MTGRSKERATLEAEAARYVFDALQSGRPELPASLGAGALLKASVLLARELFGDEYPQVCRDALENILADLAAAGSLKH